MGIYIFYWVLISIILNIILCFLPGIKLNYYKGKWGKKKEPLYKLELEYWGDYYNVKKYQIEYFTRFMEDEVGDRDFLFHLLFCIFVPIYCLFRFPKYSAENSSYGEFSKQDILEMVDFNLEKFWEDSNDMAWTKYNRELEKEKEEKNKFNQINKEFYEHY